MNKADLITAVAEKADITKKDAEKAGNAVFSSIEEALVNLLDLVRLKLRIALNALVVTHKQKKPLSFLLLKYQVLKLVKL